MANKNAPEAAAAIEAPTRDYTVLKGRLEKAGVIHDTGATVALTDAEAAHPLATGVVRLQADPDEAAPA